MSTLSYIAVTFGGLGLVLAGGFIAAYIEQSRREREMIRRPRQWRNGRVE